MKKLSIVFISLLFINFSFYSCKQKSKPSEPQPNLTSTPSIMNTLTSTQTYTETYTFTPTITFTPSLTSTATECTPTAWYMDSDLDGYGNPNSITYSCTPPSNNYVIDNTDCDDTSSLIYPGAQERCNSKDDDCDNSIDEEPVDGQIYYYDADGDGYGISNQWMKLCNPSGMYRALQSGDCDDSNPQINPGRPELCNNSIDDNCNNLVDENCP